MKSIATKVISLLFVFALSFPAIACDQSHKAMGKSADTDSLSAQVMQRIDHQFDEASF